jgi:endonuclease/exonuclease/phosphatase family metal-dependent hydrolase
MHDAIAPGGKDAARLPFIREQIAQMDPDILCITEATPDLPLLQQWAATLHVPYVVPTIPGTAEALAKLPNNPRKALCKLYGYPDNPLSGSQWIWFLVKALLNLGAELQDPKIWRRFAASQYADAADQQRTDGKWGLYYWAERKAGLWNHVRQPQVLVATIAGLRVELIGAHLRSKLNSTRTGIWEDEARTTFTEPYLKEVMNDRIKLATEAENIRKYIDARFAQDANPAVMVMGDLNDGPGREVFERKHLYFDLIGNLQGSIFEAERFLNHALFDYGTPVTGSGEGLRWSYKLSGKDPLDPTRDPHLLLDHIMFTQRLVAKDTLPRIRSGAGLVEHAIHERVNAMRPRKVPETSDHRPVSVSLTLA